ncbi:MAG: DUF4249 domain-containing protein [Prevotella sp.]|nr:DUF4249 domain-containing protein [Prevotella sp.]
MKRLPFYLFTFLLLTLSGCVEEFEADIPADDSNLLVVEGTICSGKLNSFALSRTQAISASYIPQMVVGANVSVRGSDGSEYRTQLTGAYYTCWIESLNPDVEYYLHIETDGEVYESEPQKPLHTEKIADVCGVQNTPESNIDILVTPAAPLNPDEANYYSWTYDETWEVHPAITTNIYFDIDKRDRCYYDEDVPNPYPTRGWMDSQSSLTMIGGSQNYDGQHIQRLKMYEIDQRDERISHRYSGLIHQRAITKAEYEYELARRQASDEMGGLFTPQPSALPTNIHCLSSNKRGIGYVGCSLNTTDYRFFLNAEDFTTHYMAKDGVITLECGDSYEDFIQECVIMVLKGLILCVWEDEREMIGGTLKTSWARYLNQLDVRARGAYIEEPDFWSLKENVSY